MIRTTLKVHVDSPLVLLPDEVLLGEVHQVEHGLRSDEQMLVQNLDLKYGIKVDKIIIRRK